MAQLVLLVFVVVVTFADETAPQASSVSMSISNSAPEEYGRVVLQCVATVSDGQVVAFSKDNQHISWDGTLLPGPGSSRFTLPRITPDQPDNVISLLTIQPVCKQDSGNYNCTMYQPRAGSGYDVIQSVSKEITSVVDYDSTEMCNPVGSVAVLRGDVVLFSCTSRGVSPVWAMGDGTVVDSLVAYNSIQNTFTQTITVTVSDDHEGMMYHCTAFLRDCGSSEASTRTCTVGPIIVLPEPEVIVSSTPNPIVIGGVAEFLCTVLPNVTSRTYLVGWHTVPSLGNNRAYFSSTPPNRMRLLAVGKEDQGMNVYCTVTFEDGIGKRVTGATELVISPKGPGQNTGVNSTVGMTPEASTGDTPVTTSIDKPPGEPFLLFGSYPVTIGIISGGSILVALLLALVVFCCCRKCKSRRRGKPSRSHSRHPLRISPSTFGEPTPGHEVPGSGTDGMYMYATIFDPDEKWGATPGSLPLKETVDSHEYQQPMSGASTPPVYSQVGSPTNVLGSPQIIQVHTPNNIIDNALYQSSGGYVDPEIANQQHINREMATIRLENVITVPTARQAPSASDSAGYLAIGEVPDQVRAGNSNLGKKTDLVTYMEISN